MGNEICSEKDKHPTNQNQQITNEKRVTIIKINQEENEDLCSIETFKKIKVKKWNSHSSV